MSRYVHWGLWKLARLKSSTLLGDHQERAKAKSEREKSLLVYHGLGSGKTLTSIAVGLGSEGRVAVVAPASLRSNFAKELDKHVADEKSRRRFDVRSYHSATRNGVPESAVTIFDEAHRMGRVGTKVSTLPRDREGRVLFLTGTPVRNDPSEFQPLLMAMSKDRGAPSSHQAFKEKFVGDRKVSPGILGRLMGRKPGVVPEIRRPEEFGRLVRDRVDYHASQGEFPEVVSDEVVEVEMTKPQQDVYEHLLGKNKALAWKLKRDLPPSKSESRQLNAFLSGVRQASNDPAAYSKKMQGSGERFDHSPKAQAMVEQIMTRMGSDPKFKALVYSNYLDSGLDLVSQGLNRQDVPHETFRGGLSDKERKRIVDAYNSGKLKALLVSSAGSEGLDLKGTKLVQIMEPHWNESRIEQVVGRAVRHQSHSHLPESERKVEVQRFHAVPRKSLLRKIMRRDPETGADGYLHHRAKEKADFIGQFLELLKEEGSKPAKEEAV